MENSITGRKKSAFGEFLTTHHAVKPDKVKFYQYWVHLFNNRPRSPEKTDDDPEELARFLDELGRQQEPWKIKQAQDAIR